MNLQRLSLATMGIILLLVTTLPVTGAPALSQGARSQYNLDASLSLVRGPDCTPTPHTVCPMFASMILDLDLNGTVGWAVTSANKTRVNLNVTSNLSLTALDTTRLPSRGFSESVNLTNRLVSFPPPPRFILDDALSAMVSPVQLFLPAACDPSTIMSAIAGLPDPLSRIYTMWWANGPLAQGQLIPILALPPLPVLRQETVDLGTLGSRTAWVVGVESTSPLVLLASTNAIPPGVNATVQLLFYYDTKSDLLLKSTASLQVLFPVNPSTSIVRTSVGASFSLVLASTTVSLDQPTPPNSSPLGSSNGPGSGSSQGTGNGNNAGSGTNAQSAGSNSQSPGSTGSQPNNNPGAGITQSSNLGLANSWPWVYGIFGIVVAVVASVGVWILRRGRGRAKSLASVPYPTP